MNIFHILITVVITSAAWLIYIKFFYKRDNSSEKEALRIKDDQIKDKDHEIEKIKIAHDSEIKLLNEKYASVEKIKENLEDTLSTERANSKTTLSTLKNVETFKNTVTKNMQDNTDKMQNNKNLSINSLAMPNIKKFWRKVFRTILAVSWIYEKVDYTNKKEEVYNLDKDNIEGSNPDIYINLTGENYIVCDSKVSLDNWRKFCNAENEQEKDSEFKKHANSVKKHIDTLSKKDYMKNVNKKVFSKVIMYMCHEASFSCIGTFQISTNMLTKNILLVGPKFVCNYFNYSNNSR